MAILRLSVSHAGRDSVMTFRDASVGHEFRIGAVHIRAELVERGEPRVETQLAPSEPVPRTDGPCRGCP